MANQQIIKGKSLVIDGVKYTATEGDAELNVSDENVVEGIASGKVIATIDGAKTTPEITLDGTTAFNFTATGSSETGLNIVNNDRSFTYISGKATYSANSIYFPKGTVKLQSTNLMYSAIIGVITATIPASGLEIPIGDNDDININLANEATLSFNSEVFKSNLSFVGQISYKKNDSKKVLFGKDSKVSVTDLVIGDSDAKNFSITALSDSEIDIDGKGLTASVLFKDGSSFEIVGDLLKIEGTVSLKGGDLLLPLLSMIAAGDETSFSLTGGTTFTLTPKGTDNAVNINVTEDSTVTFTKDETAQTIKISSDAESGINFSTSVISNIEMNIKDAATVSTQDYTITHSEGSVTTYTVKNNDEILFAATMAVNKGGLSFNSAKGKFSLAENSEIEFSLSGRDYTFKMTNTDVAGGSFNFDENGLTLTPDSGDGTLNVEILKNGVAGSKINVDFKSGSVTLNNKNEISLTANTEIAIGFSDDYSITLKTADIAGGKFALVEEGIQFTPNEGDGKLEVTVTNGETIRTATLDLKGEVTFALDGNISLAKDSVADFTFEDGINLKIISNEDASGTIKFGGTEGVTITPANPTALTVELSGYNNSRGILTDMTGSISYSGGNIIMPDNTSIKYYAYIGDTIVSQNSSISTKGGSSTWKMASDKVEYIPSDGATFTMSNDGERGFSITSGSLTIVNTYFAEITEGITVEANSSHLTYVLKTAGEYTLNGAKLTTTEDNVEVKLTDYNTVVFAEDAPILLDGKEITGVKGTSVKIVDGKIIDDFVVGEGESIEVDGVKYTAVTAYAELDIVEGSVAGIKSGKFEATIADATKTPEITIDGTTAFDFTAKAADGELSITVDDGNTIDYLFGAVTYDANGILAPEGELQIQLNPNEVFAQKGNTITVDVPVDGFYIPHDKNLPVDLNFSDSLKLKFDAVGAEFSFNGSLSYDRNEISLKFAEGAAFGANIPYNNRKFEIEALKESEIVF